MELCETCKKENCNKQIVTIQKDNLTIIRCLEYEKDISKIQGYKEPIKRTAKYNKTIMGLSSPSWY